MRQDTIVRKPDPFGLNKNKQLEVAKNAILHHPKRQQTAKTNRKHHHLQQFCLAIIELAFIALWIFFISPTNTISIIVFVILISHFIFTVFGFWGKRLQWFTFAFVLLWLTMTYIIGFDVINTILLASFIIGLSQLFK